MSHLRARGPRAAVHLVLAGLIGGCSLVEGDSEAAGREAGAPPALSKLSVTSTRSSPALVRFDLADEEGDAVDLAFEVRRADGSVVPATIVAGTYTDPGTGLAAEADAAVADLRAPAAGRSYARLWHFAADAGDGVHDVELVPRLVPRNPKDTAPEDPAGFALRVGNEPPEVELLGDVHPGEPLGGIVRLPLRVRDSRADEVRIRVEYQLLESAACTGFFAAHDALLPEGADPPAHQIHTTTPEEDGGWANVELLWDTEYVGPLVPASCDLADERRAVRLRFTVLEVAADPDDPPLSTELVAFPGGLVVDNEPDGDTAPPDGDGDPADPPGGDDPPGDGEGGDPYAEWLEKLVRAHPWVLPFLEVPELRATILIASRMSPTSLAVADVDADGNLDVVRADTLGDGLEIYLQTAPGVVSPRPLVLGGAGVTSMPASVAALDLDGDRDVDVVSGNLGTDDLTVFLQEPAGFAREPARLAARTPLRPMRIRALDVDRDGDLDLVVEDEDGRVTAVFAQTRPGVFRLAGS